MSAIYGAVLRFYLPVVSYETLEDLTEDLIELATSITINHTLSPWLLKLCRLSSREDEDLLSKKLTQYENLTPEQVGIGEYFTLNSSSKLMEIFNDT